MSVLKDMRQITECSKILYFFFPQMAKTAKSAPPGGPPGRQPMVAIGHTICFPQNSKSELEKVYSALPDLDDIHQFIQVVFLGPKGLIDKIKGKISNTNVLVRSRVVYQWLRALKHLHPNFFDIDIREGLEAQLDGLEREGDEREVRAR